MRRKEAQLLAEKSQLSESLAEAQERMQAEHEAHERSVEKMQVALRDVETLRTELMHARQGLEKAELDRTMVSPGSPRIYNTFLVFANLPSALYVFFNDAFNELSRATS
jgi:hypothetical protein